MILSDALAQEVAVALDEPAPPVTIHKPNREPGTNIPISWAQTISVSVKGDTSDAVPNLHTRHPDEGEDGGNTRGHHSFYVVFQRQAPGTPPPPTPPPPTDLLEKYTHLIALYNTLHNNSRAAHALLEQATALLQEDSQ